MQTPKSKVMLVHIALSTTIMLVLLSVMLLWWYPKGLFGIAGGWDGLKILLPIDMVLGPVLTFLFYKPGKKSAVIDLSAIACVQLAALSFGVYAVYSQHPQALILAEGQLNTLTPVDYREAKIKLAADKLNAKNPAVLDQNLPPVVVAEPFSAEEFGKYLESVLNSGLELVHRADRYQSLDEAAATLANSKLSEETLLAKIGKKADIKFDYYALRSMHGSGVAAFSKETGELARVIPLQSTPRAAALSN